MNIENKELLRNNIFEAKRLIKLGSINQKFEDYLQTTKLPKKYGHSRSNIYALEGRVTKAQSDEELELLGHHVDELLMHAKIFYNLNTTKASNFFNSQYYLYFFYTRRNDHPTTRLGRAVMRIDGTGNVEIHNIKDGSEDYVGMFELVNQHVMFVDAKSIHSNSKLHLKIEVGTRPKPYSIGLSLSYEHQTIISGTLVLQHMEAKLKLKAAKFTHLNKEFFNIDPCVRSYLSLKKHNQLKTPHDIQDAQSLCNFVDQYEVDKSTNFFDQGHPIMFISTPTDSIDPKSHSSKKVVIKKIKDKLNKEFTKFGELSGKPFSMDIRYPGEENLDQKSPLEVLRIKKQQVDDFVLIERTTFFILIYEKEAVSKSLIELGMALNTAKNVWVYIREGVKFPDLKELERHPRYANFKIMALGGDLLDKSVQDNLFFSIYHNVIISYPQLTATTLKL